MSPLEILIGKYDGLDLWKRDKAGRGSNEVYKTKESNDVGIEMELGS